MTDPMMDFFDDANLFSETLEGLSDDAFVQPGPVSLVDELNLGAEFEPLHIDSLNHVQDAPNQQKLSDFEQLNQYDSLKLHQVNQSFNSSTDNVLSPHSQFNCSPIHPQNQSNGMFPDVADGSPMWGHQTATTVSNQNGSPFHQGHSQSMQQNKSFVAHHDFALFQANEPQHQCASLRSQQSRSNTGQDALSQPKDFMEVNVSTSHRVHLQFLILQLHSSLCLFSRFLKLQVLRYIFVGIKKELLVDSPQRLLHVLSIIANNFHLLTLTLITTFLLPAFFSLPQLFLVASRHIQSLISLEAMPLHLKRGPSKTQLSTC